MNPHPSTRSSDGRDKQHCGQSSSDDSHSSPVTPSKRSIHEVSQYNEVSQEASKQPVRSLRLSFQHGRPSSEDSRPMQPVQRGKKTKSSHVNHVELTLEDTQICPSPVDAFDKPCVSQTACPSVVSAIETLSASVSPDSISKDKLIVDIKAVMKVLEAEQDHFELELKNFNAMLEVLMSLSDASESYALDDVSPSDEELELLQRNVYPLYERAEDTKAKLHVRSKAAEEAIEALCIVYDKCVCRFEWLKQQRKEARHRRSEGHARLDALVAGANVELQRTQHLVEESENNTRAAFERLISRRGHLLMQNDGASTAWLLVKLYEKLISTDDGDKILLGECTASHTATAQLIVKRDVQRFLVTLLNQANQVCTECFRDESERLRLLQQASEELISGHFNNCGPRLHNLRRLYSDCHSAYQCKANEGIGIEMRAQLLEDEVLGENISCNTREARVQTYRSLAKESTQRLQHIAETIGTLWVRMNTVLSREMLLPLRRPFRGLPVDHQLLNQSHSDAADSPQSEYHPMKLEVVEPFFDQPSTAVIDLTDDGEPGDSMTTSENSESPLSRLEGEPVREGRVTFLPEDSQVKRVGGTLYTKEYMEDDESHFFRCHVKDVLPNNAFRVVYDDNKEDVVESKFLFTNDQMKTDLEDQDTENLCQCAVM